MITLVVLVGLLTSSSHASEVAAPQPAAHVHQYTLHVPERQEDPPPAPQMANSEPGDTQEPIQIAYVPSGVQRLTREALLFVFALADVPVEWRADLADIAFCESSGGTDTVDTLAVGDFNADNVPQSLSYLQLWRGWPIKLGYQPEDLFDVFVAARVGTYVRASRGRFGGGGGWTCADLLGIY